MYQSVFTALLEIVGVLTVPAAHHSRFLIPASSLLSDLIQGLSLIKGQTYVLRQRKLEEVWGMCYSGPMGFTFKSLPSWWTEKVMAYRRFYCIILRIRLG